MDSLLFLRGVCILLCFFSICGSIPIRSVDLGKLTCKHNRSANKTEWKKCVKDEIPEYDEIHAQFEDRIYNNNFDDSYLAVDAK